jgi:hypothetical protein
VGLTTLPPSCVGYLEIWETQLPGSLKACPGLLRDVLPLLYITNNTTEISFGVSMHFMHVLRLVSVFNMV